MKKFFARARAVLEDKGGEGYVDTAVKMIIAVVIGALLLGGLYYIPHQPLTLHRGKEWRYIRVAIEDIQRLGG